MEVPSIPEFFKGQKVLVTGSTGFMGKVLIEKLLRSCPDVDTVFLLIREKKGLSPKERWDRIVQSVVFEKIRQENPDVLNKVVVLNGDASLDDAGLCPETRKLLAENVTIVFHIAAIVLFFENMYKTLRCNTRATWVLAELAKTMANLKCFLHVSTTFCNCDKYSVVEEKMYDAPYKWQHVLHALDSCDESLLCGLSSKILDMHPNAYTLSKALAEQIMKDYSEFYPVVIIRPSVVLNSYREPVPGWLDTLHGPSMMGAVIGSGLLRVCRVEPNGYLDFVACDYAVNGFIAAAWDMAIRNCKNGLEVYNCGFGDMQRITAIEYKEMGLQSTVTDPMENQIWHPFIIFTTNEYLYHLLFFILQIIPAIVVDSLLRITGHKPILWKLTKKIAVANIAYSFFMLRCFDFPKPRYMELQSRLLPADKEVFFMNPEGYSIQDTVNICAKGVKKYLLNEKEETLPARLRLSRRFNVSLEINIIKAFLFRTKCIRVIFLQRLNLEVRLCSPRGEKPTPKAGEFFKINFIGFTRMYVIDRFTRGFIIIWLLWLICPALYNFISNQI